MGCKRFNLGHAMLNSVDPKWTLPDGYDEGSPDQGYHRGDFFSPFFFSFYHCSTNWFIGTATGIALSYLRLDRCDRWFES